MNTNSSSPLTLGVVGYVPHINVAEGMRGEDVYKRAREHVLQSCIGFVLDAIEARAKYGFKCTIGGETMVLFPRLGCISLDTPEKKNILVCATSQHVLYAVNAKDAVWRESPHFTTRMRLNVLCR